MDIMNHHIRNNVKVDYDGKSRAFKLSAIKPLSEGAELVNSYGVKSDTQLFNQYGFCNGDGSGPTVAKIAPFHELTYQDVIGTSFRGGRNQVIKRKNLLKYLLHDDGYKECIQPEKHPEAAELKLLKMAHLERIADDMSRWLLPLPPRNPDSVPLVSTDIPITLEPPSFDRDAVTAYLSTALEDVLSTCRLITLTHRDLNGGATALLKDSLEQDKDVSVEKGEEALEVRAHVCLARLASTSLDKFGVTVEEEMANVAKLNRERFQTRQWNVAHERLGEMQSLQAIIDFARGYAAHLQLENPPSEDFMISRHPCPTQNSAFLLEQEESVE
jgi:hypothetical protein